MSQLIRIRTQIKSIQTTKKITYAMRLISMSLYSKLEKLSIPLNYFSEKFNSIFHQISQNVSDFTHPLLQPKDILDSTPLIIVTSSTKGLCGSFNSQLFKYFQRNYLLQEHQKPKFITIGQKATNFINEENIGTILYSYNEFNSNNFLTIANEITKIIQKNFYEYSSVIFYSNIFKSFFIQKPHRTTIIPIEKNVFFKPTEEKTNSHPEFSQNLEYEFEQNSQEIINFLAIEYLKTSIINLLFQSLLAEQASRFLAMDHATTNAENFLEKLNLQYNKSRQALITKELSEISASFNDQ